MSLFDSARFRLSVSQLQGLPVGDVPEIAFAGRSNAGKSTTINVLTRQGRLAFASKTPGRTQLINFFDLSEKDEHGHRQRVASLVDLPGYGFAKVSQSEKERWGKLMEDYFAANRITLGILIVDYRHPPTNNDITMARWFLDSGCPFAVVANKMDKLKKSELEPNLKIIRQDLELPDTCPVIPFSAEKGDGRDALVKLILDTLEN